MKSKPAVPTGERLPAAGKKRQIGGRLFAENLSMLWMVIPGLVLIFLFWALPFPQIVLAFKDFKAIKGVWGSEWVGLDNLMFFLKSPDAPRVIRNTLAYNLVFLVVDALAALCAALMFYFLRSNKALKLYNTTMILPRFMSSVIIAFMVYGILHPTAGLLNKVIMLFGGDVISWYTEPKYWPVILTIVHIWQTVGMNSVMYYSSLISLDPSQLEAAEIDGANRFQQIIHIIIPHLLPIMITMTILNIGHIMSGDIGLFNQTTKNVGILYPTTDVISTYTYRALLDGAMAKSAAVGIFQSLVGLLMVIITNLIVKKYSPENSMF